MRVRSQTNVLRGFFSGLLRVGAAVALVLGLAPGQAARSQSADFDAANLSKQRTALCLEASRVSPADLESSLNHLAVLSETCRIHYGAKACDLAEKPLGSQTLEERYAYYVKRPVEAHSSRQGVKIDRRNWEGSGARGQGRSQQSNGPSVSESGQEGTERPKD